MISVPTPASVAARPPPSSCRGVDRGSAGTCRRSRTAAEGTRGYRAADCRLRSQGDATGAQRCASATVHDNAWHRSNHGSLLPGDDRRPCPLQEVESVGTYVGLTTRRYASGEIDWTGRISKCGDKMLRSYLYEAANVLLTRVAKWSTLKAWASDLRSEAGSAKPRLLSLENLPSSCTGCGSMAPSSIGHRRRPLNAHNASSSSRLPGGK